MVSRLEVVETGCRRRWSEAEKLWIVEESLRGRRLVSATARRHGISRSLLTSWRRARREGRLGFEAEPGFAPVIVAPEPPRGEREIEAKETSAPSQGGRMEIGLADGRRIVVGPDVDAAALARVVAVLERA